MATAETAPTDTRERLLAAAIDVFLEHGYAKTRVQDIARRAGLTTGAMYAHFDSKADLLSEAISAHGESAIKEVVDRFGDGPSGPKAIAMGVRMLAGPSEPADRLMLEALAVTARGDESVDLIAATLELMRAHFTKNITAATEAGLIDESIDVTTFVSLLERLVLGSIVAKAIDLPTGDPDAMEKIVATMLLSLTPNAT